MCVSVSHFGTYIFLKVEQYPRVMLRGLCRDLMLDTKYILVMDDMTGVMGDMIGLIDDMMG